MKNVFAVKHQKTHDIVPPDGEGFVVQRISETQLDLMDRFDEKVKVVHQKTKLSSLLSFLYYAMIFISIASILGIVGGMEEVSINVAFQRGPIFFILLPLSLATWIGLALYKRYKRKSLSKSQELKDLQAEGTQIIQESLTLLGVPSDAIKIDTLHYFYDEKNGELKPKSYGSAQYFNLEMYAYTDQEAFYLANLTRVFRFPLSGLKRLMQINQMISMDNWNKKEPINAPEYVDFKIKANSTGAIFYKPYYLLILENELGEEFSIIFPVYEKEIVEKLTGLTVTTDSPLTN